MWNKLYSTQYFKGNLLKESSVVTTETNVVPALNLSNPHAFLIELEGKLKITELRTQMQQIAKKLRIKSYSLYLISQDIKETKDWQKVTKTQFYETGGRELYKQYGSLSKLLMSVYPEYHSSHPNSYIFLISVEIHQVSHGFQKELHVLEFHVHPT